MLKDAMSPAQQIAQETFDLLRRYIEDSNLPVPSTPRDVTQQGRELQFLQVEKVRRDPTGKVIGVQVALVDYTQEALAPVTPVVRVTLKQSIFPGVDAAYIRKGSGKHEVVELTDPLFPDELSPSGLDVITGFKTFAERFTTRRGYPNDTDL